MRPTKARAIEAARQEFEAKKMAAKTPKAAASESGPLRDTEEPGEEARMARSRFFWTA